jgi:hypothetical protein
MSDSKSARLTLELITDTMNELAREIEMMEPDDPKRASYIKELSSLTQLRRSLNQQAISQSASGWTSLRVK